MGKGECDDSMGCVKYLLFFFNAIFLIAGVAIIAVGVWVRLDSDIADHVGEEYVSTLFNGAYVIIAFGIFIFVVTFLGCCGAIRESQCMLFTFFLLLLVIFVALVSAGAYVLIKRDDMQKNLSKYFNDRADSGIRAEVSALNVTRDELKCCAGDPCMPVEYTDTTCASIIWTRVEDNAMIIGGVALGIAFILILGMVFALCLCCSVRRAKYSV